MSLCCAVFYGKAWWRTYEVSTFARKLFAFRKLSSGVPIEVVADLLGMAVGDVQAWVLESTFVPRAFLLLIGESTSLPPQQVKQVWSQFVEANVSGFVSQTEEDQQAGTFQSPTFAQVVEALGSVGITSVQDAYKAAFKNETSTGSWMLRMCCGCSSQRKVIWYRVLRVRMCWSACITCS